MQETWVPSLSQEEIPWSGNGNPLQNPCLENPMDKGICPGGLQSTGLQRVRHNEVIQQQSLSGTLLTRKTLSQASIHFRKRKKNWDPWRECLSITMSNFPNRQSSQMRGDSWIPIKHSYTNKLVHDEEGWDRVGLDRGWWAWWCKQRQTLRSSPGNQTSTDQSILLSFQLYLLLSSFVYKRRNIKRKNYIQAQSKSQWGNIVINIC